MQESSDVTGEKRRGPPSQSELLHEVEMLRADLARERTRLQRQRAESERQRQRAEQFRRSLKAIQRASFRGDVYHFVLEACVGLTASSRGIYVADEGKGPRIRAVIGCGDYRPGAAASPFIAALAQRVLSLDDAVVCGDIDTRDLPAPRENERFATCAAVPVAVRGNLHGVIIVADKQDGRYDEHDLETLLHVGDQASVAVDNAKLQHELEEAYVGTVGLLADAVETKDPYTRGHCQEVSRLARLLAVAAGLDDEARETVCLAALLHDVGKIGVSDAILHKPAPLDAEERRALDAHVRIGADLMRRLPVLHDVADVVLHHHERFDGSGYPSRLAGEAIPIGARIVAVVDAYCAMTDERPYKPAFAPAAARAELERCAGAQFDPRLVELFLGVLDADAQNRAEYDGGCGILPSVTRRRHAD